MYDCTHINKFKKEQKIIPFYFYLEYLFVLIFLLSCIQTVPSSAIIITLTIPIFMSTYFFPSPSTDSSSVVRDKTFIRCFFIAIVMAIVCHSHVEDDDAAAAFGHGQCVFFIRRVMVAIKIKQLVLYFISCLLLFYFVNRRGQCCYSFFHSLSYTQFIRQLLAHFDSKREKKNLVLHSFYVSFMITDISVAVNSPVDDDTGCKLHFTRLVCQTSMIRKSRQIFFLL